MTNKEHASCHRQKLAILDFKPHLVCLILAIIISDALFTPLAAQNPIIRDQFTADPSARVFNNKVYVFPSHDIRAPQGKNLRKDWFCMEDYHVFSSENLSDWTDHGVILSQYDPAWVDSATYSMWAPDCVERDGKYYFYFPANTRADQNGRRGFGIGVAVAERPQGPYLPQAEAIRGVHGIDPNVFIDKDGQAYLYWSQQHIFVARLKENMLELDSEPYIIPNLPDKGLKEGPWVFEREGIYYLTFPHVENKTERLEYAVGKHPMGPFTMKGVIMDESPVACWTNHHSILEYRGQWYLFYHHNDYSPDFDKNRSIRIDSLFFKADGSIQKVNPSLRGVGLSPANTTIQLDRYSALSPEGAEISFIDKSRPFEGWKTRLNKPGAWVQYNAIDFGNKKTKSLQIRAQAQQGGSLELRLNSPEGPLLASLALQAGSDWENYSFKIKKTRPGIVNLFVLLRSESEVEIDWLKFQP
ncbi:MAG: family 43 glycosylhydrolase [Bacteroidales bacterium]|nr:family 43 glycosylhydrolase [Bacteroidales bacterium]MDD4361313.1 family 43 glycosylhydrolase [Bacteroidales bacterium]